MSFNDSQYDSGNATARRIDGALVGSPNLSLQGQLQHLSQAATVTIPMTADNWRKLSRETQIRVLEETGVLKAAQREQV